MRKEVFKIAQWIAILGFQPLGGAKFLNDLDLKVSFGLSVAVGSNLDWFEYTYFMHNTEKKTQIEMPENIFD